MLIVDFGECHSCSYRTGGVETPPSSSSQPNAWHHLPFYPDFLFLTACHKLVSLCDPPVELGWLLKPVLQQSGICSCHCSTVEHTLTTMAESHGWDNGVTILTYGCSHRHLAYLWVLSGSSQSSRGPHRPLTGLKDLTEIPKTSHRPHRSLKDLKYLSQTS